MTGRYVPLTLHHRVRKELVQRQLQRFAAIEHREQSTLARKTTLHQTRQQASAYFGVFATSKLEAIGEGCDTAVADAWFSLLSRAQIESVEAIAMDMSAAFVKCAKGNIPLAEEKIVHDRFHVMKPRRRMSIRCDDRNIENLRSVMTSD